MPFSSWARIEAHAQTTDIDVGLAAEVADPLWFLLRQLQLGELTGDDAGTPVAVDIAASWSKFSRYRAEGSSPFADAVLLADSDGPIEATVEREPVIRLGGDVRETPWTAAVQAGRSLRRLLVGPLSVVADRLAADPAFQFTAEARDNEVEGADDVRYRALLAGKVIDGVKVLDVVLAGGLPAAVIAGVDADAVAAALTRWEADLRREWGVAAAGEALAPAWVRDRLEYAFSIAAPPLPGEVDEHMLQAAGYDGTGVQWYSLDHVPLEGGAGLGAVGDVAADPSLVGSRIRTLLPAPLTYPGMPADRFWEMEDAAVALGRVGSGPTDLAKMLAVDFAIVYGPDWLLAPVEVPVGCLARIDWVVVRDTFGVATLVGTAATQAGDGVGRQFQPSNAGAVEGDIPLLVVLPSALASLNSDPREEVALQRDEVANLAWSIEKTVMGPSGRGVPRPWFRSDFELPAAESLDDYELIWRLATPVAETWTPLVAVHEDDGPRLLRKGKLLDTATTALVAAKSQLLADIGDVREEEVTSAGIQLRMTEQLARWHDGSTFVWRGRERRPATGEAASGLRFDATTPKPVTQ